MTIIYLLVAMILIQIRVFVGLKIEIHGGMSGQNPLDLEIQPQNKTGPNERPQQSGVVREQF